MSHPVNDEILENLFEESYDYFSRSHPDWTEEKIVHVAEGYARKRFEDLSQ
jgi:hypothetical protein